MAIITPSVFASYTGQTYTGADLVALTNWCNGVDATIKRLLKPYVPEPTTLTDLILDAPIGNILLLPAIPVRSITSLYLRPGANGVVADFETEDLLTAGDDYFLPLDSPVESYSLSGRVLRRGASSWGVERRRPVGRLADTLDPHRGAVKATFDAGPTSVPHDILAAAVSAVALMFSYRTTGVPLSSESWNGRSESNSGPFTSEAAVNSPNVLAALRPYRQVGIAVG